MLDHLDQANANGIIHYLNPLHLHYLTAFNWCHRPSLKVPLTTTTPRPLPRSKLRREHDIWLHVHYQSSVKLKQHQQFCACFLFFLSSLASNLFLKIVIQRLDKLSYLLHTLSRINYMWLVLMFGQEHPVKC